MSDLEAQAAAQLSSIEESTGMTVAAFADAVREARLEKHSQIVSYFKSAHGLTHGRANVLAHAVRDRLAGGPRTPDELLAAQYHGAKAVLRPVYDELVAIAESFGDDVTVVIQKTGVSFRRRKQFALVQAASSKRVQLGLNLDNPPADSRLVPSKGMCARRVDLTGPDAIDDDVAGWLLAAYERAG